jgi:hypothetical protein
VARGHQLWEYTARAEQPKEARKKLSDLANHADALLTELDALDDLTRPRIATALCMTGRAGDLPESVGLSSVTNCIYRLRGAIKMALRQLPTGAGRPRLPLTETCIQLARIYEMHTGRTFTREKSIGIWTPHAEWVAKAARAIHVRADGTQLDTAMRNAVAWLRKNLQKPAE